MTNPNKQCVAILGTLDTRGDEVAFIKDLIEAQGHRALVIDMGVLGTPMVAAGDYDRDAVARAGGSSLEQLVAEAQAGADRGAASQVMIAGARKIVADLVRRGEVSGVMGLGGSTAAASGAAVMSGLPVGFPKLLLTTFLRLAPVGDEDIVVMQAPVDLLGMNALVARALANAAGALLGMAQQQLPATVRRPVVGITALGVTTPAVMNVVAGLDTLGYDGVVFHALTDKLNRMIEGGAIDALIDLTTFETTVKLCYGDEQLKAATGAATADRRRLPSLAGKAIPQIIAPGGLDMHILPGVDSPEQIPDGLKGRPFAQHAPGIMLVRTSAQEMQIVAQALASRLNEAGGPVAAVIPLRGFSDASRENAALQSSATDQIFIDTLKRELGNTAALTEVDCNINDALFAATVIDTFKKLIA